MIENNVKYLQRKNVNVVLMLKVQCFNKNKFIHKDGVETKYIARYVFVPCTNNIQTPTTENIFNNYFNILKSKLSFQIQLST